MSRPRKRVLRKLSSRWRLNLTVLVALVIVFMCGGWAAVHIVSNDFIDQTDDQLRESATGMTFAVDFIGREEVLAIFNQTDFRESDEAMLIVEPDGNVIPMAAGTPDDPEPLPDVDTSDITELRARAGEIFEVGNVDGGAPRYRVITSPLEDGSVAVVAISLQGLEHARETVVRVIFIVAVTIAVALMVIVAWISHHQMRPLEKMIETAQTISGGELDTRLDDDSPNPDVARLAGALNAMLARLQQAFADQEVSEARLRQFVGDASHELRTPLAAILGYAELYQQNVSRSPEQVDHAMDRITLEGRRMQTLVEELLLLARLDQGAPMQRDRVDLVELVDDAVNRSLAVDPSRPIDVVVDLDDHRRDDDGDRRDDSVTTASSDGDTRPATNAAVTVVEPAAGDQRLVVDGSPSELARALDNLLTNARLHTPAGTAIRVRLARSGNHAVLEVADDGPGMSAADAARAFDRFFRAEPSRARPGGNGLGLSIVAAIARAHDGTIDLDTAPGEGATFTIAIPVRAGSPA